jgi:hypothetical protein
MTSETHVRRLIPWAWSAAWLLAGLGIHISDIYSSPSRSQIPYFVISALGWGIAGVITASASRGRPGMAVRLAAWMIAALVAILFGLFWLYRWNMAFFGPIVATGLAGAIGGVTSSVRKGAWRLVSGALLGLAFLLFATVSFMASYFLMLVYTLIAQQGGSAGVLSIVDALIWPLPGAVFGLGAGFAARWLLGLQKPGRTSLLNLEK